MACGTKSGQLQSSVSVFPDDLKNKSLAATGIYDDGWTGKTLALSLKQPSGEEVLVLRGLVPKVDDPDYHAVVEVTIGNKLLDRRSVGTGNFEIVTPVEGGAQVRRITADFSATQRLPGGDNRLVGARLSFVGFESAGAGRDIVHGAGLHLGTAWAVVEKARNDTFRWVENDAQVEITADKTGDVALTLVVEPGPGVGGPFLLKALDSSGRQVAAALVSERERVTLFVPVEAQKVNEFRLHVDGAGKKITTDPRVLNFRVFRISAEPFARTP